MTPGEHLEWFEDNIDFFASVAADELSLLIPSCPPWTMLDLLNHLSFGLGACYPVAASTAPEAHTESIFADLDRDAWVVEGDDAVDAFTTHMRICLEALSTIDPNQPCWTYAGPGTASFWFLPRRGRNSASPPRCRARPRPNTSEDRTRAPNRQHRRSARVRSAVCRCQDRFAKWVTQNLMP